MADDPRPEPSEDHERAATGELGAALAAVVPALERFMAAEHAGPAARGHWRARLDEPLPGRGEGAAAVLARLADTIVAHGLPVGLPGFCGWVNTAPATVPAVAQLVGSVAAAQRWWVHPGNFLEEQARRWLAQLLGLPPGIAGAFTSGGAAATILALGAARQHAGERRGADVATDGCAALPSPRIYAAASAHAVTARAASVLGLGRALRVIPAAHRGLDLAALAAMVDADVAAGATPVAVVASAGTVDTGDVEPIDALREIAHTRGVWLHVDGAYGAFAAIDERVRARFGALAQVDSLVVCPHKWLAVPVGCGAALVQDGALLSRAFPIERAGYLRHVRRGDGDPASPFDELGEGTITHTFEHSAPARGLVVWAALCEIGAEGVRARVARHLDCARRVAARVRAHERLELVAEPVLSTVCFRYRPPGIRDQARIERANRDILAAVRARGRALPSSVRVRGKLALRACFIGPRAGLEDADALVDEVLATGAMVSAALGC